MISKISNSNKINQFTDKFKNTKQSAQVSFTGLNPTKIGKDLIGDGSIKSSRRIGRFTEELIDSIRVGFRKLKREVIGNDDIPYAKKPKILEVKDPFTEHVRDQIKAWNSANPNYSVSVPPEGCTISEAQAALNELAHKKSQAGSAASAPKPTVYRHHEDFNSDDRLSFRGKQDGVEQTTLGDLSNPTLLFANANLPDCFKSVAQSSINKAKLESIANGVNPEAVPSVTKPEKMVEKVKEVFGKNTQDELKSIKNSSDGILGSTRGIGSDIEDTPVKSDNLPINTESEVPPSIIQHSDDIPLIQDSSLKPEDQKSPFDVISQNNDYPQNWWLKPDKSDTPPDDFNPDA